MEADFSGQSILRVGESLFTEALKLPQYQKESEGVFVSPVSIYYALLLALNGAGTSSLTYLQVFALLAKVPGSKYLTEDLVNQQFQKLLDVLTDARGAEGQSLTIANSVWAKDVDLLPSYTSEVQTLFKAEAARASSAKDINAWVAEATKGKIKEILSDDNFSVVLANALYFKGFWKTSFKKSLTHKHTFAVANGAPKDVDMMSNDFEYKHGVTHLVAEGVLQAVQLPYKGDRFSAVAILPAPGVAAPEALRAFFDRQEEFQPVRKLRVLLPKFHVESSLSLAAALQSVGVTDAFSAAAADFSRLSATQLFVSEVVHKTVVEVDEEGTEAAAATAVIMNRAMPIMPEQIVFDRPFLFLILHSASNTPVFIGSIQNPTTV